MVHLQGNVNRRSARSQRRLRPGIHERRSLGRREVSLPLDYDESISIARDSSVILPTEWAKPSPLRRQTFDQSWLRWKAKEAELKADREREEEQERERREVEMFGGDIGDDELRALGILYDSDPKPEYTIRYTYKSNPRRGRRNAVQINLPLYFSASALSQNPDIARFLATQSAALAEDSAVKTTPQSLPPLSGSSVLPALDTSVISALVSHYDSPSALPIQFPASPSISLFDNDTSWDFLAAGTPTSEVTHTPISEPETWILLSDDS